MGLILVRLEVEGGEIRAGWDDEVGLGMRYITEVRGRGEFGKGRRGRSAR